MSKTQTKPTTTAADALAIAAQGLEGVAEELEEAGQ
jgi:hypothetical protein